MIWGIVILLAAGTFGMVARTKRKKREYDPEYGARYHRGSGQVITKRETERTETAVPMLQMRWAIICRALIYCSWSGAVFLAVGAAYLLIAEFAILIAAYIFLIVGAVALNYWLGNQFWNIIAPMVAVAFIGTTAVATAYFVGVLILGWEVLIFALAVWAGIGLVYSVVKPAKFGDYRMSVEIVDPNYPPPRSAVKRLTPIWPDTEEPMEEVTSSDIAMITDTLQQILRQQTTPRVIAPVAGNWGRQTLSQPEPKALPAPQVAMIEAPSSGNSIPVSRLAAFARNAPAVGVGAAHWKKQPGWTESLWTDCCEIWETVLGAFERGRPGKSGRFTVETDDALQHLFGYVHQYGGNDEE